MTITIASNDPTTPLGTVTLDVAGSTAELSVTDEDGTASLALDAAELAALLAAGSAALAAMLA